MGGFTPDVVEVGCCGGGGRAPEATAAFTARRCRMRSAAPAASDTLPVTTVATIPEPTWWSASSASMHRCMSVTQPSRSTSVAQQKRVSTPAALRIEKAFLTTPTFSSVFTLRLARGRVWSMPYSLPSRPPNMSMSVNSQNAFLMGPVLQHAGGRREAKVWQASIALYAYNTRVFCLVHATAGGSHLRWYTPGHCSWKAGWFMQITSYPPRDQADFCIANQGAEGISDD